MGGFVLVDPEKEDATPNEQQRTVLTLDYFKEHPDIRIPKITAAAIEDRSKGDALSKIITILQTTWFIVQCIARGQQRLALTELELVTLALASLNAVTFAIWWHKPLGVQDPVQIYFKVETEKVNKVDEVPQVDAGLPIPSLQRLNILQDHGQISFDVVISKSWGLIKEIASNLTEFLMDPCDGIPFFASILVLLFLPIFLIYFMTLPFFILFPLGTIFLLRVIKTEPTPREMPLQSRGLLANRIVSSLRTFRFRLTSEVSEFVESRMVKIIDGDSFFGFFYGLYILLPSLFLFITLFVILLIPFFTLFFLLSFIFTAVFDIVTTTFIRPGASHVPSFYAPST